MRLPAFSKVRAQAGTTQVDFEVDHYPPADSQLGAHLTAIVEETVKDSFEKMKKKSIDVIESV